MDIDIIGGFTVTVEVTGRYELWKLAGAL